MRRFLVVLHRWTGLLTAAFLVLVGLTGSLLAFDTDLERLINPQLFVEAAPGRTRLDLASLAIAAERNEPRARVGFFWFDPSSAAGVAISMVPRVDPATRKPYILDFDHIFLDPYTGRELGKRKDGDLSQGKINIVPFIYKLHTSLALGDPGTIVLGIVALAWTIDCFVSLWLTFPRSSAKFLRRWSPSWAVKATSNPFRLNFDLHRASGLWLWPMLFVFAWSSVMFNLPQAYTPVTSALFGLTSFQESMQTLHPAHATEHPMLNWRQAQDLGARWAGLAASEHGYKILRPFGIGYIPQLGVYTYDVRTNRDVGGRTWEVGVWLDGDSGRLQREWLPDGGKAGDRLQTWLYALHWADFHDWLAYRILVAILGVAIALLSGTGIYIWWRKRAARVIALRNKFRRRRERRPGRNKAY